MPGKENPTHTTSRPGATASQTRGTQTRGTQQIHEAQQTARGATQQVRQKSAEAEESVKQQSSEAAEESKRRLREEARKAQTAGKEAVEAQKRRVADEIETIGDAVGQAAHSLHEDNENLVAGYADEAARQIHNAAGYLRDCNSGRLLRDAENFSRARPELVFGGLFVAGLGIARFLKASDSRHRD